MTLTTQEISTDYDLDYDDPNDVTVVDVDKVEIELDQLLEAACAVETYGIDPSSFGALKATNLLAGTSLMALACEAFGTHGPDDAETELALEGLGENIQKKTAEWSAKILAFAKNSAEKVVKVITDSWVKIADIGKGLLSSAWDKAKAAGTVIRAHPYKTIFAMLVAAVAVAAVAAAVASGMPGSYANETALQSFMYKVKDSIAKIKLPFGKIDPKVVEGTFSHGKKFKLECAIDMSGAAEHASEAADKLGWTQSAIRAVGSKLSEIATSLKSSVVGVSRKIIDAAKAVNKIGGEMPKKIGDKVAAKTGSGILGWAAQQIVNKAYMTALWSVVGVLYNMIKTIVLKAYKMVQETFTSLKPIAQTA